MDNRSRLIDLDHAVGGSSVSPLGEAACEGDRTQRAVRSKGLDDFIAAGDLDRAGCGRSSEATWSSGCSDSLFEKERRSGWKEQPLPVERPLQYV